MKNQIIEAVMVDDDEIMWTRMEICQHLNMPSALLEEMEDLGLFAGSKKHKTLSGKELRRIEKAIRIHVDLGVNLSGTVLILELLDELEDLRQAKME